MRRIPNPAQHLLASILRTVALFTTLHTASGQTADALTTRIEEAQTNSSLDTSGLKPWHLKIAVQRFDEKGTVTEQGTIDEFWAASGKRKIVYDLPSAKGTHLFLDGETYRTKGMGSPTPILLDLLEQIVHPLASSDLTGAKPDLRKKKFGKVELDCIMLDQELKHVAFPPFGLFPTYCLDPGKTTVRIVYDVGTEVFLRNSIGRFQTHEIATQINVQMGETKAASAQVSALTGLDPQTVDFTVTPDLEASSPNAARIGAGVMAGSILFKAAPRYPEAAKQNHVQGSVVLHALIARDGNIRSLRLVGSPDSDLAMAAIAAVKQWRYKPYLLNGEPTEVDTTITVNFSFGPGL